MTAYTATARREDDLWVIDIPGCGVTQGTDRADAEHMARDYIATVRNIPYDDVTVTITWLEGSVWDQMVTVAMEVLRRAHGFPGLAEMEEAAPDWRGQCEDIVTAVLGVAFGSTEPSIADSGTRCPRCNPDNTCTLWCLEAMAAENVGPLLGELSTLRRELSEVREELETNREAYFALIRDRDPDLETAVGNAIMANIDAGMPHVATAAIMAMFAHYETPYADPQHLGSNLLNLYLDLAREFGTLQARRCTRYTCDHLETVHRDAGCERCSCPALTRTPTR